jgi:hypothetical protein
LGEYCTAEEVAKFCNLTTHEGDRAVFGTNPETPSEEEVEDFITLAEEYIQDRCGNAWGNTFIQVVEELKDFYCDYLECAVQLNHPNIATLSGGAGDKIEAWMGNTWKDWVADYTEGRGDDFHMDYKLGKLWFITAKPPRGRQRLKLTYRYNGGATVPGAIKMACALQVGIFLSNSDFVDILFPEGAGPDLTKNDMIRRWQSQVSELLKRYEVSSVPVGLDFVPVNW